MRYKVLFDGKQQAGMLDVRDAELFSKGFRNCLLVLDTRKDISIEEIGKIAARVSVEIDE